MVEIFISKEVYAALIGATSTIVGVFIAIRMGLRTLRDTEIRRLRIKCVTELVSYRFVLSPIEFGIESKVVFLAAVNAVPALFGDDTTVM